MTEFYYLLMSKAHFLKANVIEEVLREKGAYYFSRNKKNDFWIIEYPKFLYEKESYDNFRKTRFYSKTKNEKYFAIVSSEKIFIKWLSLRIGHFEALESATLNDNEFEHLIRPKTSGILGTINSLNPFSSII